MKLTYLTFALLMLGSGANTIVSDKAVSGSAPTFVPREVSSTCTSSSCLDTTLSLRGGEVLEAKTLADVESIVMKASNDGKLVVIDFSAVWCGPCRYIAPLYHEMSESDQFSNVVFVKVDVDENQETAVKYEVSAMPTFVFIKRGEVVDKLMGANVQALESMLEELA